MCLDRRGNLTTGATRRALEEHVLEVVREAGAEVIALVDAAGLHPNLDGADRRRVVVLEQDGQAVGQCIALDRFAPEFFEQGEVAPARRGGFGHCAGNQFSELIPRERRELAGTNGFTKASSKS